MLKQLDVIPASFFSRDGASLSRLAYAFLILICIAFFTPGIMTMPPTDRDESLFAQASKQMIESGNYTDIRVQDAPRYKKPIGIYWLQSSAVRILNPHNLDEIWAYRIPSFLGATIAVLMTAALGSLLFSPVTGLLAAIMLAGCVLLEVEARIATTDGALLASVMIALWALAKAYLCKAAKWLTPITFWTAIAAGFLLKGPIVLLPIIGVLVWLRISDKNIKWFNSLHPLLGALYALVLVSPWFIAISLQSHGLFMQQSAGHDMLAKIWEGQNRGMMPPGMYLIALPILFFPYALFTAFAVPDIWKARREASVKFCLGWLIPTWIVFELSMTKLPHYVLPTYPAIALLTAKCLVDGFPSVSSAKHRFPIALIAGTWLVIGSGLAFLMALLPFVADGKLQTPQAAAGMLFVVAQAFTLLAFLKHKTASLIVLTLGGLIFLPMTFGVTVPSLQHLWVSREIVDVASSVRPCAKSQIVSVGYHEPSLVFLAGTNTILANTGDAAAKALSEDSCRVAVVDNRQKQAFLDAFANTAAQPKEIGEVDGLNAGHGSHAVLSVYVIPPRI